MTEFEYSRNGFDERSERICKSLLERLQGQGSIVPIDKTSLLEFIRMLAEYRPSLTDNEIINLMESVLRNPSVHHYPHVSPSSVEFRPVPPEVLRSATPEEASLYSIDPLAALMACLARLLTIRDGNSR